MDLGLHMELMALAVAFGPFPARTTQRSDSGRALAWIENKRAVNVQPARSDSIEAADEGGGVVYRQNTA